MPALLEEDSDDVFLIPEPPRRQAPRSNKVKNSPRSKLPINNLHSPLESVPRLVKKSIISSSAANGTNSDSTRPGNKGVEAVALDHSSANTPLFDNTTMSSIWPVRRDNRLCSTQIDDRRESVMTDIDEGSFIEFTSSIPEGRVIPHIDSLKKMRDNLYFTCESQPNVTKYSTSTKISTAKYGFHKLVKAIDNQRLLQQVHPNSPISSKSEFSEGSKERPARADDQPCPPIAKTKVLNSTMVGDKRQSRFQMHVSDISSLTIESESYVDDSIPLATPRVLVPTNSKKVNTPIVSVLKASTEAPKITPVAIESSLISEDVSLADSGSPNGKYSQISAVNKKTPNKLVPVIKNKFAPTTERQLESNSLSDSSVEEVPLPKLTPRTPTQSVFRMEGTINRHFSPALSKKLALVKKTEVNIKQASKSPSCRPPATPVTPKAVKSAVCQWVMNSPFKDGSFDTSFLRQMSDTTGVDMVQVTSVPESSDEDEQPSSKEQRKINVVCKSLKSTKDSHTRNREQVTEGSRTNERVLNPNKSTSPSITQSDSSSLKLHLESSCRTGGTVMTIGRVADLPKPLTQRALVLADSDSDDTSIILSPKISVISKKKNEDISSVRVITTSTVKKTSSINSVTRSSPIASSSRDILGRSPKLASKNPNDNLCASPNLCNYNDRSSKFPVPEKRKPTSAPLNLRHSESSDSDGLSNYMKRWRDQKKVTISSDESDDECEKKDVPSNNSFIDDGREFDDDLSFYLPTLSERLKPKIHIRQYRNDRGSDEKFRISTKECEMTPAEVPRVYSLDDSSDSLPSLDTSVSKPLIFTLSDSDDDAPPPPKHVFMTPKVRKTPKPASKKLLACPNTVASTKPTGAGRVVCKPDSHMYGTPTLSFLSSLSAHQGNDRRHPDAFQYHKSFSKLKDNLVNLLYKLFNSKAFDMKLPEEMKITWNVRLTTTAGYCFYQMDRSKPSGRGARIELSVKVVDNCERLRDTLVHELCHAAAWIISGYKAGHGSLWKAW